MKIRQIRESDVDRLSQLHINSLPDTVSSKIGKNYLECIYKSVVKNNKRSISLVAIEKDNIIGAIVTTADLSTFQSNVKRKLFPVGYLHIVISLAAFKFSILEIIDRIKFENELVRFYTDRYATFIILFTDVKYRKKGIATKLIKEALKFYKGKVDKIYVDTQVENIAAKKLYKSIGFKFQKNVGNSTVFLLKLNV